VDFIGTVFTYGPIPLGMRCIYIWRHPSKPNPPDLDLRILSGILVGLMILRLAVLGLEFYIIFTSDGMASRHNGEGQQWKMWGEAAVFLVLVVLELLGGFKWEDGRFHRLRGARLEKAEEEQVVEKVEKIASV
jgi:hypothetical protein